MRETVADVRFNTVLVVVGAVLPAHVADVVSAIRVQVYATGFDHVGTPHTTFSVSFSLHTGMRTRTHVSR